MEKDDEMIEEEFCGNGMEIDESWMQNKNAELKSECWLYNAAASLARLDSWNSQAH